MVFCEFVIAQKQSILGIFGSSFKDILNSLLSPEIIKKRPYSNASIWGTVCLLGGMWQCVEIFLIATTVGSGWDAIACEWLNLEYC